MCYFFIEKRNSYGKKLLITSLILFVLASCSLNIPKNSDESSQVNGTSDQDSSETGSEGDQELGSESSLSLNQKLIFVNGSTDDTYGIGRSVNALTDKYIEPTSAYGKIFDDAKITNVEWKKRDIRASDASYFKGDSASTFLNSFSLSVGRKDSTSASIPTDYGTFTAGLETNFGLATQVVKTKNTQEILVNLHQNICGYLVEIDEYRNIDQFSDYLSNDLLNFIDKIVVGEKSVDDLFFQYGTHAVMAAYYGGRIDMNYHLLFEKNVSDKTLSSSYVSSASAELDNALAKAQQKTEISSKISNEMQISGTATSESFSYCGKGGNYIAGFSLETFSSNYSDWVQDFNDDESKYVLIDLPDYSLVPLWELLPAKYSSLKVTIKEEFARKVMTCKNDFLSKYDHTFSDFDSGNGSASLPYKIKTKEQLTSVNDYLDGHYFFEVINDITVDSTDWNPLGFVFSGSSGSYKAFNGNFNGNNHLIKVISRTTEAFKTTNNEFYFGLFAKIDGAMISNVNVEVKIQQEFSADVPENWYYFGGITGYANNSVIVNCSVSGEILCGTKIGIDGSLNVGGIVGNAKGTSILYCANHANLSGRICYRSIFGGILGFVNSSGKNIIKYCYNTGDIVAIAENALFTSYFSSAGGIVGSTREKNTDFPIEIKSCFSYCNKISGNNGDLNYSGPIIALTEHSDAKTLISGNYYLLSITFVSLNTSLPRYLGLCQSLQIMDFSNQQYFSSFSNQENLSINPGACWVLGGNYPKLYWEN